LPSAARHGLRNHRLPPAQPHHSRVRGDRGQRRVAPYETPGTKAFAETVLPYVKTHNTMLLANHGIVCWADTVTRAEWCAEVLDTYCWTLMLAAQLGSPILRISEERGADLRALRKNSACPEFPLNMPPLSDASLEVQSPIALQPTPRGVGNGSASVVDSASGPSSTGGPNIDGAGPFGHGVGDGGDRRKIYSCPAQIRPHVFQAQSLRKS